MARLSAALPTAPNQGWPPPLLPQAAPGKPEFNDGMTRLIAIGALIIAGFFGALGIWVASAPLNSAAIAPGVVNVESNRKTVQHLEGGVVEAILVGEGELVRAGQPLIRVSETQPRTALMQLRLQRFEALALEARLIAERDSQERIALPAALAADAANPSAAQALAGQLAIFAARRAAFAEQTAVIAQRIAQLNEEILGLEGRLAAQARQAATLDDELRDAQFLYDRQLLPRPRFLSLQRQRAELDGARSQDRAAIARANQGAAESRLRIAELRAAAINEVTQQHRTVQAQLLDLDQRILAAEEVLGRSEIRAPLDGRVVGLQMHTVGGVITAGQRLLDVVPIDEPLIVEAQVDPKDIDVVRVGQPTQIRLMAFSQRFQAPVEGRVMSISADRLTDQRTGQAFYLARVRPLQAQGSGAFELLQPGMQAEVIITTGSKTVLEYLLGPLRQILARTFRED